MSAASDVCLCVEGPAFEVDVHDRDFKRTGVGGVGGGYQIQTWAALLGLTNEELLCARQRNLQHPPFISTGGRVCLCMRKRCVCLCVCACARVRARMRLFSGCVREASHNNNPGDLQVNQSGGVC